MERGIEPKTDKEILCVDLRPLRLRKEFHAQ
jgi:hypothetical protein